jgi:uncharacterized membrane protein YqaE (UPF0057 family)
MLIANFFLRILAVFLPTIAVYIKTGRCTRHVLINFSLWSLGLILWLLGFILWPLWRILWPFGLILWPLGHIVAVLHAWYVIGHHSERVYRRTR